MPLQSQDENANDDEKAAAQKALFEVIATAANGIANHSNHKPHEQTGRIRDLALAYRLAAGGPQPGTVDK